MPSFGNRKRRSVDEPPAFFINKRLISYFSLTVLGFQLPEPVIQPGDGLGLVAPGNQD